MLIRFASLSMDRESGNASGMLVVAHQLRDEGDISCDEHEVLRVALLWFTEHLPIPKILRDVEHRRALSWFKPTASDAISQMWNLKQILESHDIHVQVLSTHDPGIVIYEDEFQVIAKPRKGQRF